MIETGVWKEACPISLGRLREVQVSYYTFKGTIHHGSLVVLDVVAPYVQKIFKALFKKKFPFDHIKPIDFYQGNDDASMEANNSSAFNYRPIAGTSTLSLHSYGIAIDINPIQNPFVKNAQKHPEKSCSILEVWPSGGPAFLNRARLKAGMVEPIVDIFYKHGFRSWGGHWETPIDLHHFEVCRNIADFLAAVSEEEGKRFFDAYVKQDKALNDIDLLGLYQKGLSQIEAVLAKLL